jgi:hypothetical protein
MEYVTKPESWNGLTTGASSPAEWVVGQPWTAPEEPVDRGATRKAKVPTDREPPDTATEVVNVVELTTAEIESVWTDAMYVPPADDDAFVRCQKIVIAYCTFYAPTVCKGTYTLEYAYQRARKVARPLAALGAGIPLSTADMREFAFEIHDSLASWADANDSAAHAIGAVFAAYAAPRGDYRQVKAGKSRR